MRESNSYYHSLRMTCITFKHKEDLSDIDSIRIIKHVKKKNRIFLLPVLSFFMFFQKKKIYIQLMHATCNMKSIE